MWSGWEMPAVWTRMSGGGIRSEGLGVSFGAGGGPRGTGAPVRAWWGPEEAGGKGYCHSPTFCRVRLLPMWDGGLRPPQWALPVQGRCDRAPL